MLLYLFFVCVRNDEVNQIIPLERRASLVVVRSSSISHSHLRVSNICFLAAKVDETILYTRSLVFVLKALSIDAQNLSFLEEGRGKNLRNL